MYLETIMFVTRLAATIGLIIMVAPNFSSERSNQGSMRALPPTPLQSTPVQVGPKPSVGLQILKDSSQFMIKEFENACSANISHIKSFTIDPVKPEGYGTNIQYYTQSDKAALIENLNRLLKKTTDSVNTKLGALDKEEMTNKKPFSDQDILEKFREIYGILNEGRKNCTWSLAQIEKQMIRSNTLKECSAHSKKDSSNLQKEKKGISHNVKKYLPGSRNQKKDQQTESSDVSEREPPTTSSKAKNILGTKETKEEQRQRFLLEALEKSGLR